MWIFWLVWIAVGCLVASWTYRSAYRVAPYNQHLLLREPLFGRYQLLFPTYAFDGDEQQTVRNYSLFWQRGRWLEVIGWCAIASLGPLRLVWACLWYCIVYAVSFWATPYQYPPTWH